MVFEREQTSRQKVRKTTRRAKLQAYRGDPPENRPESSISFSDALRAAVAKAKANPPQTNPSMSTIVITVEVVMGS